MNTIHNHIIVFLSALFVIMLAYTIGCTDEASAQNALLDEGYTEISLTGYQPFSCSQDDGTSTGFRAIGPTGRVVHGVVCCGFFTKGCTIRH